MRNFYAMNAMLRHYPKRDTAVVAGRLSDLRFMSLNHRYLYFEVTKAACSALKPLLLQIGNCRNLILILPVRGLIALASSVRWAKGEGNHGNLSFDV